MEELSLFDFPQVEINKPIRLIELFGGIGSQAMALRDIGANFEHYRLVEFDKYAVASYNAIHGTNFTTTDIRDVHGVDMGIVNREEFTYLLTYSFPCTDLSVAGKMKGMSKFDWENGKSTRSGLLWEVERILKELKDDELPQILLMENVPQVHSEQNIADFESWLNFLRSRGYYNFYQDLNAKDYGIPQNRERCFCVSILSDEFIDFNFPKPIKLKTVMKDYLEEEVDEKYYINNEKSEKLIKQLVESGVLSDSNKQQATSNKQQDNGSASSQICQVVVLGKMDNTIDHTFESANRVYDKNCLCPTIPTCAGGNIQPKIIEETHCVGGLAEEKKSNGGTQYYQQDRVYKGDIALALPANLPDGSYKYIVAMRGRNPEHPTDRTPGIHTEQRLEMNKDGLVNTLTTVQKDNLCLEIKKVGQISNDGSQYGTVISEDGLCSTLTAGTHGYANNCISVKQATKEGSIKCKVGGCYDASYPDSKTRRGRVQDGGDTAPTLTASSSENINYVETVYRIRKLTPKECFRLMGYTDRDFEQAAKVNSNSQLYKQAGNAIVKQVLEAIFLQMNIQGLPKEIKGND